MEQNTKKNIAREILILTTILVITFLCWLTIYPYNTFKKQQISTAEKRIEIQNVEMDSLRPKLPRKKRKKLYNTLQESQAEYLGCTQEVFINAQDSKTKLIDLYNAYKYQETITKGFNEETFAIEYADDLSENSVSSRFNKIESSKKLLAKSIEDNGTKIFTSDEHKNLFIKVLGFLFCLAYPLRFLFLAVKWSLKILKE